MAPPQTTSEPMRSAHGCNCELIIVCCASIVASTPSSATNSTSRRARRRGRQGPEQTFRPADSDQALAIRRRKAARYGRTIRRSTVRQLAGEQRRENARHGVGDRPFDLVQPGGDRVGEPAVFVHLKVELLRQLPLLSTGVRAPAIRRPRRARRRRPCAGRDHRFRDVRLDVRGGRRLARARRRCAVAAPDRPSAGANPGPPPAFASGRRSPPRAAPG